MSKEFDLEHIFSHHPPGPENGKQYADVRGAARDFAEVILQNTPPSADQSDAIRKVREAVMTANAAIALGGRLHRALDEEAT